MEFNFIIYSMYSLYPENSAEVALQKVTVDINWYYNGKGQIRKKRCRVAQVAQIVTTLSYHSYAEHYTQLGDQPMVSQFPAYRANTASTTTRLTLWIESCSHKALGLILVLLLD